MTWIKLDDGFFSHPSTTELVAHSPGAALFHIAAICWCSHQLTDGRVPDSALHLIAAHSQTPPSVVDEVLADSGRWERHEDGRSWLIVNYLEWQESRATIEEKREKERLRKQKQREGTSQGESQRDTEGGPDAQSSEGRGQSETPEVDDGFEDFWQAYPSRDGKKPDKAKARSIWKRMSGEKRAKAMIGVGHYAASGWRAKDAHRWLRDECWETWQTPATTDDPDAPKLRVG